MFRITFIEDNLQVSEESNHEAEAKKDAFCFGCIRSDVAKTEPEDKFFCQSTQVPVQVEDSTLCSDCFSLYIHIASNSKHGLCYLKIYPLHSPSLVPLDHV